MERIESYTIHYTKIDSGYMAQLVEWPEVLTEGVDLDDARECIKDALHEMILAYKESGWEIPTGSALMETLPTMVA
ncbi:MAG: type II toxin-antitoxin system HicB family antitoxin [Calditrichaeota bacterium]|nr:type II toxin-antitoxin system HicB family antitoxin [Calditrichota bacterium]